MDIVDELNKLDDKALLAALTQNELRLCNQFQGAVASSVLPRQMDVLLQLADLHIYRAKK